MENAAVTCCRRIPDVAGGTLTDFACHLVCLASPAYFRRRGLIESERGTSVSAFGCSQ